MTQDNTKQVRRRRRYSAQFKAELVAEYLAGGVSLASLAISHDINPNILHRWVREHKRQGRHRLNEITGHGGASKPGHAITPANWIPVHVPNTIPSERSPASAKPQDPRTAAAPLAARRTIKNTLKEQSPQKRAWSRGVYRMDTFILRFWYSRINVS